MLLGACPQSILGVGSGCWRKAGSGRKWSVINDDLPIQPARQSGEDGGLADAITTNFCRVRYGDPT